MDHMPVGLGIQTSKYQSIIVKHNYLRRCGYYNNTQYKNKPLILKDTLLGARLIN